MPEALYWIPCNPGVMAHICHPSTQEMEEQEFKAILSFIAGCVASSGLAWAI